MSPHRAPPPLGLDFVGGLRRPGWLGWAVLAFGVIAAVGVLHEYDVLETRVAEAAHALTRTKHGLDLRASGVDRAPVTEQEARPARAVAQLLQRDWRAVLGVLETAGDDPGIALLALDQEGARGGLRLTGEGRSLPEVFAYVKRLEAGGVLREVRLGSYEFHASGPLQVVGFTVTARWEVAP